MRFERIAGDPEQIETAVRGKGAWHSYVELHIEQGGTLDKAKVPIGIVEGIVAIHRYDVVIEGQVNHAGTTPMNERHDAMVAAAQLTLAVRDIAARRQGRQVGTVGRIEVEPNSPNVIPGRVDDERRVPRSVRAGAARAGRCGEGARRGDREGDRHDDRRSRWRAPTCRRWPRAACRTAIGRAAAAAGLKTMRLPSGAGHDAQQIAKLCPMGMIFVPSVGGISHSPKELTTWEDCANGANVLLRTVLDLDQRDSV